MAAGTAILVLGMHRSGTSCLAGMLAASGLASSGASVRNWDNARGHHEMLDAVRLDEAVLAHSGGHWLSAPAQVRWTDEHAAIRDHLLAAWVEGRPALLKDPRSLLVLPFWRASTVPCHTIAIVRHPLAVARSLESWRGMPLAEGIALWTAHNRVLAADHAKHRYALIDFEQNKHDVVAAVVAAARAWGELDVDALAEAYDDSLVHHDVDDVPAGVPGLTEAIALYQRLTGPHAPVRHVAFPRAQLAALEEHLRDGHRTAALGDARDAVAAVADVAAVLVPATTMLIRHRALDEARALVDEVATRVDVGLAELLRGKILIALGDAAAAVVHLERACAVPAPYFQARHLLPQALRAAGRRADARQALREIVGEALYPHGPLATLAEWSWLDGDRTGALAEMASAIAAAPPHRRGRLRTRRAEWLIVEDDEAAARAELEQALVEDPAYSRTRDVLGTLSRAPV